MTLTRRQFSLCGLSVVALSACTSQSKTSAEKPHTSSHIEVFDPALEAIVDPNVEWEILASDFQWAEGPTWDKHREQLYFTDVPANKAYVWKESRGAEVFLDPSGSDATEGFREPGANGLLYVDTNRLLLANHGLRAVQMLNLEDQSRQNLIDRFDGKKFNSPNDLVMSSDGHIYFSDPPYGLAGLNDSPMKEQSHNGVYRLSPAGDVELLTDALTFPNGVSLSPDETTLYVAQSDPQQPVVFAIDINGNAPKAPEIFFDMKPYMSEAAPGLPDGFAMCETGDMFVTGPGGVFILSPDGQVLGRILTGSATANCAFGEAGRTLFITAQDRLLRIPTKALGLGWS